MKKQKQKISVLIPFYNEEKGLRRTLECVFSQDYPKNLIEVICVNDGSADRSVEIVRQFPVVLLEQDNSFLSKSYNRGLEHCTGDFILKLDAHMYLTNNNSFSILNYHFIKDPTLAGVCGTYRSLEHDDRNFIRDIRREAVFKKGSQEKKITLEDFTVWSSAIGAYRRSVLEKIKFPEEFANSFGEDAYVQIILQNQGYNFYYTPEIVGIHDARISTMLLFKKMKLETLAMGNILLKSANQKETIEIPHLAFFLSYPFFLVLSLVLFFIFSKVFIVFVIFFTILEVSQGWSTFFLKDYSNTKKIAAFHYLIFKEVFQTIVIPLYFIGKIRTFYQLSFVLKVFYKWEIKKMTKIFARGVADKV